MSLSDADHDLVTATLGREPTPAEVALFENLWSEHCAYRSSRPLLSAFDSESDAVVVGPGDDAAVLAVPTPDTADTPAADRGAGDYGDTYVTFGIESHNHPSYVDPFDGAATGVGGIVRDTLSMGAYPIALLDSLYFGEFSQEESRYLFDGVVEGIAHYGNCIGVPTVGGSVAFHDGYEGNPLVNVAVRRSHDGGPTRHRDRKAAWERARARRQRDGSRRARWGVVRERRPRRGRRDRGSPRGTGR